MSIKCNDDTISIITTIENREPVLIFLDRELHLGDISINKVKGNNRISCEPIDEGMNDLGQEVKITLTLPNLSENYKIINGFAFVNYSFEECFGEDSLLNITAFGGSGVFIYKKFDEELTEDFRRYWESAQDAKITFSMLETFRLMDSIMEYLDKDRRLKEEKVFRD